jgi:hypothetical protein
MITDFSEQRVSIIDGNKCLFVATKKALQFLRRSNLKTDNFKDIIKLTYHFFVLESIKLKQSTRLKFNCTIVFYTADFKSQLLSDKFFKILYKKIKNTSPIPVFLMNTSNKLDLPYAALACLEKNKSNMNALYKHANNYNLTFLKRMLDKPVFDINASDDLA